MKINWVPKKNINKTKVNKLLQNSIQTNQFTNYGPNVQLLEKIIRQKLSIDNSKAIIAVSNGSVALHSVATAFNYYHNKNIQWATQSFTFPPSVQSSLSNTIIIDIDKEGGLDLKKVDINVIDGIIVTNVFGNVVDINKYEEWASKYNKFLIFDNAATPYTFYKGKSCCNYGNASTISFHHTKPIGFGEGGAIIVDKKYESFIRSINNFGINLNENEYFLNYGNNYKMSDISASYIIQYLDNFNMIYKKHTKLYKYLTEKINSLQLPFTLYPSFHDKHKILSSCFCLLFDNYHDDIRIKLLNNKIFCRKYYNPLKNTTISMEFYNKILCIPCNTEMTTKDLDFIIGLILN